MNCTEDPIYENIGRIQIIKIDIMLSTSQVVPLWECINKERVRKCLWPRITLGLDGKQIKIPLITFQKQNASVNRNSLSDIGRAIFKLASGKLNKHSITKNQFYVAYKLEASIRNKISIKLSAAANKKTFTKKIKAVWRKKRRQIIEKKVLDVFREAVLVLQKHDIIELWEEQKRLLICSDIIYS
jgi:hypothetical protein